MQQMRRRVSVVLPQRLVSSVNTKLIALAPSTKAFIFFLIALNIFQFAYISQSSTPTCNDADADVTGPALELQPHHLNRIIEIADLETQRPQAVDGPRVHVMFSTDCSFYQDWQSEVLVYSHRKLNWPGIITRIVSCDQSDWNPPPSSYDAHSVITVPSFNPHTPTGDNYAPRNRPHSLQFLFENHPNLIQDEDLIFLMDPDQILLKPYSDFGVELGKPAAAGYAQGTDYLKWAPRYCSECDFKGLSWQQMLDLRIGAPYILYGADLKKIIPEWIDVLEQIRLDEPKDNKGGWISDMFAYSIASVKVDLMHRRMPYSVSNVDDNGEPWNLIANGTAQDPIFLLHYCQLIDVAHYKWIKHAYKSKNLLTCSTPLQSKLFPEADGVSRTQISGSWNSELRNTRNRHDDHMRRNSWMYTNTVLTANEALKAHHQEFCL